MVTYNKKIELKDIGKMKCGDEIVCGNVSIIKTFYGFDVIEDNGAITKFTQFKNINSLFRFLILTERAMI